MNDPPLRFHRSYLWLGRTLIFAILALSLLRFGPAGLPVPHGDKWGHMLAYAALTFWYGSFIRHGSPFAWRALSFIALGGVIEILQAYTGYRTGDWADLAADAFGVALGYGLALTPAGQLLRWAESKFGVCMH